MILSPHLDDAVFSCGGFMARWRREGLVLVINVFTDFSNPPPKNLTELGAVRFQEEARASARLGFESLSLNFTEAVCRNWKYASPGRLFGGVVFGSDRPLLEKLQFSMIEILKAITFDRLFLPLGVGWHVDHLLCHQASARYHQHPNTRFYEDRPYALVPQAVSYRLRELGGPSDSAPLLNAWGAGVAAAHVVNEWAPIQKLKSAPVRWGARWITPIFFARLFEKSRARWVKVGAPWTPRREEDGSLDLDAWVDAAMEYRSQVGAFFMDRGALKKAFPNSCCAWVPSERNGRLVNL